MGGEAFEQGQVDVGVCHGLARGRIVGAERECVLGLLFQLLRGGGRLGQLALNALFEGGGTGQGGFLGVGKGCILLRPGFQGRQVALADPNGAGAGALLLEIDPAGEQGLAGGLLADRFDGLQLRDGGEGDVVGDFGPGHALGQQGLGGAAGATLKAGGSGCRVDIGVSDHGADHALQVAGMREGSEHAAVVVDAGVGIARRVGDGAGHRRGDVHIAQAHHHSHRFVGVGHRRGGEGGGGVAGCGGLGRGFAGDQGGGDFGQGRDVGGDRHARRAHIDH